MKLIGGVIVIFACGLIGQKYSGTYVERNRNLVIIREFMIELRSLIRFGRTDIIECFEMLLLRTESVYYEMFSEMLDELNSVNRKEFGNIWRSGVRKHLQGLSLKEKDLEALINLGERIGFLDVQMQLNTIDLYLEELNNTIIESRKDINDKCKVINILGIMCGLMIFIVLI